MAVHRREYDDENGKPVWGYAFSFRHRRYRKAGFLTKREAEYAEQVMRQKVMVEGKSPTPTKRIRFADLLPLFFEQRQTEVAPSTAENERRRQGMLLIHFGKRMVDEINEGDILAFRAKRKNAGLSNRAVNLDLTLVRTVFKFAVTNGNTTANATVGVKNLPETVKDHPLVPDNKLEQFIAEAEKNRNGKQLVVWIKLRALTGLRPSESLHLEWPDIDLVRNQIFVRPKEGRPLKGKRFRPVEIHPTLRSLLIEWRKHWEEKMAPLETPHQWVFYHPSHPEQRAQSFNSSFDTARKKAGIPHFRPYDLRHYFISQAIMSGVDLFTVSKWSGHASTKMIDQVYGHLTPEFRAQQMARIQFNFLGKDQPISAKQPIVLPSAKPIPQPA
jgi:integrase